MPNLPMRSFLIAIGLNPDDFVSVDKIYLTPKKGTDIHRLSRQLSESSTETGVIFAIRHETGSLRFAPDENGGTASDRPDTTINHAQRVRRPYED